MLHQIKILKLITLGVLLCNFIFGQEEEKHKLSIGLHGAPAGATLIGNFKQHREYDYQIKPRLGFIAGLNFQYQITQKFALCFEANYESKGFIRVFNNISSINPNGTGNGTYLGAVGFEYKENYIVTLITTKLKLNKKKIAWYANIGSYADYLIGGNQTNFGLVTGLEVGIPIKERFQFSIEARNNLGIGNIIRYSYPESFALLFGLAYKI